MTSRLTYLIALSAVALGLGACTPEQRVLNAPPGNYENQTSSTDSAGTTTDKKTSTNVSVDQYGNKTAVVKTKTTKDPKGLFNKTTTENSTQVIK